MEQKVIFSKHLEQSLAGALSQIPYDRLFVLTDSHTHECCWPVVSAFSCMSGAEVITIAASDTHKTLAQVEHVWQCLQRGGATRHSCMVNLGGGMVTDLGGFAASTFKRGIRFINIPTTLLAMVDASVGGKTGINYGGLKNEIGVFSNADVVILDTLFLHTLDAYNLRSGYAEMLKHGFISDEEHLEQLLAFDIECPDMMQLADLLRYSVQVKERIVTQDPHEHGIRRALNLGHTVGHALESFSMVHEGERSGFPMLHGYAVAFGMVCELYLSTVKAGLPAKWLRVAAAYIRETYGTPAVVCDDYDELIRLMHHDKKNVAGSINFTYMENVGAVRIDQTATDDEIKEALDFLREGF